MLEDPGPPVEDPRAWKADIVYQLWRKEGEFSCMVEFVRFPGEEESFIPLGIELARRFSERFSCRSICDGSGLGDDSSPYWSVVWDRGVGHLADDSGTLWADGSGGPVRIVRRIKVPPLELGPDGLPSAPDLP